MLRTLNLDAAVINVVILNIVEVGCLHVKYSNHHVNHVSSLDTRTDKRREIIPGLIMAGTFKVREIFSEAFLNLQVSQVHSL